MWLPDRYGDEPPAPEFSAELGIAPLLPARQSVAGPRAVRIQSLGPLPWAGVLALAADRGALFGGIRPSRPLTGGMRLLRLDRWRIRAGVEVDDDRLAAEIGEADLVAVLVWEREIGGGVACREHLPKSSELLRPEAVLALGLGL